MFVKMQRFPIKYFDTNTYGDIMSRYTNDTDALELMLCQSITQALSTIITSVFVFVTMLTLSIYLTLIVIAFLFISFFVTKIVGSKSRKYFIAQQLTIGKATGYIEEMIKGQKVIKVFNHEDKNKEGFDKINDEFCHNSTQANKYANIIMPIMVNLGHVQYAIIAVVGGFVVFYELDLFYTTYYFFIKPKTIAKSILNVLSNLTLLIMFFTDSIAHFLFEYVSQIFGEEVILLFALFFIYIILRIVCAVIPVKQSAKRN